MAFKKVVPLTKSSDNSNKINQDTNSNKLRAVVDPRDRYQRHRHYHHGAGIGEGLPKVQRHDEAFLGVAPQQQRQIMAAAYADYTGTTQDASRNTIMNVYDDTYFSIIGLVFACLGFVMIVLLLFTPNNNHTHNKLVVSSLEAGGSTTGGTIGTSNSGSEQGGCGGGSMKGSISTSNRVTSRLRVGSRSLKKKQDDLPYYDSDYEYDTDVVELDLGNTTFNEHLIIHTTNLKPPALTHRAPSTSGGNNPNSISATASNSITNSATATANTAATTSTTNTLMAGTAVSTCLTGTGPTTTITRQKQHVLTTQSEPSSSQHHNGDRFLHHPGLSGFLADQSIDLDCSFEEEEEGYQGSINDEIDDDNSIKIHTITTTTTTVGSGATSLLRNRKLSQNISTTLDHQGDFSSSASSSPVVSNTNVTTPYLPSISLLSTPIASIAPQEHHRPIPVYTSSYSRSNSMNSEGSHSSSKDNINLPSVELLQPNSGTSTTSNSSYSITSSYSNSRKSPMNFLLPSDNSHESGIGSNRSHDSTILTATSSPHFRSKDNILTYQGEETPRMHNQNREKQTHLISSEVKEKTDKKPSQSKRIDPSEIGIDGWDFAYTSWNTEQDNSLSTSNSINSIPEVLTKSPLIPFVPDLILKEDQITPLAEFNVTEVDIKASSNINSDKVQQEQDGWSNSIEEPSVQQQQIPHKQQPMSDDKASNQQKLLKDALLEVSSAAVSNPRAAASTIQHKRSNLVEESSDSTTSLTGNIKYNDLNIIEVIGGGGFGVVYKATWLGTPVAVKMLNYTTSKAVIQEFAAEINLLSGMRHPNICLYIGACLEPSNLAIVTELAVNGSLWDALRLPLQCGNYTACDGITFNGWVVTARARENASNHLSGEATSTDTNILAPIAPPIGTWPWSLIIKVASGMARGMAYLHSGTPSILHR
jgi:hypothetical protein